MKRKPDEGRYSKVSRRIWGSKDFRELSAPKPNAQTLWLRILTGPELGCIPGLFEAWEGGLASALRWSVRDFRRCWEEIEGRKMASADWNVGLIWAPNAIHHNFPENPNTVKGWRLAWKELPDCALKQRAAKAMMCVFAAKDAESPPRSGPTWVEAFQCVVGNVPDDVGDDVTTKVTGNVPPNRGGNQDQDQEQEQEQEQDNPQAPVVVVGAGGDIPCPEDLELTAKQRGQLMLVPDWAIEEITRRFRAQWVGSTDGNRTLDRWRRSLSTTVSSTWNDSSRRPKKPDPEAPSASTLPAGRPKTYAEIEREEAARDARRRAGA